MHSQQVCPARGGWNGVGVGGGGATPCGSMGRGDPTLFESLLLFRGVAWRSIGQPGHNAHGPEGGGGGAPVIPANNPKVKVETDKGRKQQVAGK